jgi:DNA polymerase III subunit delta'
LQTHELESLLAKRRFDWPAPTRSLVARLSGGAVGKALSFDLEAFTTARKDALVLLNSALNAQDHSELFRTTEGYRAGAEGKAKTDQLLRAMYSLLEDMLYVKSGTPALVRNSDISAEIAKLAAAVDFEWIAAASQRLGEVESGMRRNVLRSLSLDAFAAAMERQPA